MNTKLIMTLSALILGLAGIILTFMPDTTAAYLDIEVNKPAMLMIQIVGALYFGFAMLNWMIKGSLIGGIYNRPIAVANFSHFLIAGLALIKGLLSEKTLSNSLWIAGCLYLALGIAFGIILMRHPMREEKG